MTKLTSFLLQFGCVKDQEHAEELIKSKNLMVLPPFSGPYLLNEISLEKVLSVDRVFITKKHSYVIGPDRMPEFEAKSEEIQHPNGIESEAEDVKVS